MVPTEDAAITFLILKESEVGWFMWLKYRNFIYFRFRIGDFRLKGWCRVKDKSEIANPKSEIEYSIRTFKE